MREHAQKQAFHGLVEPEGTTLRDGLKAGVGDRVVSRLNDRRLVVGAGWVKNGDTWVVTQRQQDGSLRVQRPAGGPSATLPATYVAQHVELAYATTAYRAQGATVDTAHALVAGPGITREVFYVMLTRAREANHVYVSTERAVEPLQGFSDSELGFVRSDREDRHPMPRRIHSDERSGLEVGARHVDGGEKLRPDVRRQHRLRAELDHARGGKASDGEERAEVEVLGEDDLLVAVRVIEDHAIRGVWLAHGTPVHSRVASGRQELSPSRAEVHVDEELHAEIGISISSTRQAA